MLSKHPIKEAKVTVRDLHSARLVYRRIERELGSFNQMKRDGVLQTAKIHFHLQLLAQNNGACGTTHINWNRMFSKSSALAASERSIAESMLGGDWDCSAEGKCHGVEYKSSIEIS